MVTRLVDAIFQMLRAGLLNAKAWGCLKLVADWSGGNRCVTVLGCVRGLGNSNNDVFHVLSMRRLILLRRVDPIKGPIFLFQVLLLGVASLPAATPLADQELEAVGVNTNTWLETDA